MELTKLAVVVSIAAPTEYVGHPGGATIGYVSEHGDNFDIALFPSQLQGITSKKFNSGLFDLAVVSLFGTLFVDIRLGKRVKNRREEDRRGEGGGILYG